MFQYRDHDLNPDTEAILVNEFAGLVGFRISQFVFNDGDPIADGLPATIFTLTDAAPIQFRPGTFVGGLAFGCDLFGVVEASDGQHYFIGGSEMHPLSAPATVNFAAITRGDMTLLSNRRDTWQGTGLDDVVDGKGGNDSMTGGLGFDLMVGGKGADVMKGGKGNDTMYGCEGRDRMLGGNGADRIDPGEGRNVVTLGAGSDTIVFKTGYDTTTVKDFDATNNREKIDLSGVDAIRHFNDLSNNHMVQTGADVHIDDGAGLEVVLRGVSLADLSRADFLFV